MTENKKIRRKVVCVYGKFDNKSDFVIEPACDCEDCKKNGFWIEKCDESLFKSRYNQGVEEAMIIVNSFQKQLVKNSSSYKMLEKIILKLKELK